MLGLIFSSKLDWGSIAETASKKIGALFRLLKFLSPEVKLLSISVKLPYNLTWNTIAMVGLVPLAATCYC